MVTKKELEKILEEEGFLSSGKYEEKSSYYDSLLSNEDVDCMPGYHVENIYGSKEGVYCSKKTKNYLKTMFDF